MHSRDCLHAWLPAESSHRPCMHGEQHVPELVQTVQHCHRKDHQGAICSHTGGLANLAVPHAPCKLSCHCEPISCCMQVHPTEVLAGSTRPYWWRCTDCECGQIHEWQAAPRLRNRNGTGEAIRLLHATHPDAGRMATCLRRSPPLRGHACHNGSAARARGSTEGPAPSSDL